MKIKSILIRGMHNVQFQKYDIGDINYIFGRNGAGKSTILQAIQLALLGYIPGHPKTNAGIFKHANGPKLEVEIEFDDGNTISRMYTQQGKSVITTVGGTLSASDMENIIGEIELPVFDFSQFISQSSNAIKSWFTEFLSSGQMLDWKSKFITLVNENSTISEKTKADIIKCTNNSTNISEVNKVIKGYISFYKSEKSAKESNIEMFESMKDYKEDKSEEELQSMLMLLQSQYNQYMDVQASITINKQIESELEIYANYPKDISENKDYVKAKEDVNNITETLLKTNSDKTSIESNLIWLKQERANLSVVNSNICPLLKIHCTKLIDTMQENQKEIEQKDAEIKEFELELSSLNHTIQQLNSDLQIANQTIYNIERDYAHIASLSAKLVPIENDVIDIDPEQHQYEINMLQNRIAKCKQYKLYETEYNKILQDKAVIGMDLEALKELEKLSGTNGIINDLMTKVFEDFGTSINEYLSILFDTTAQIKFNMSTKNNSFSMGIDYGDGLISYETLSSGEKCLFVVAILLAIINNAETELKLLMVDDLLDHLDDTNIEKLFNSLPKITNTQIILAGVKPYTGKDKSVVIEL